MYPKKKFIQGKVVGMTDSGRILQGLAFDLRVSRRRRSVGLTVTDRGEVLVHAPQGLPLEAVHRIVEKNLAWIEKKRAALKEAWGRVEPGKAYVQGRALALDSAAPGRGEVQLADGVLRLSLEFPGQDPWPILLAWYCRQAASVLTGRVRHFAPRLNLTPPPLELRDWRRRWGECRPDGRLRFNWRLILLPPDSLDYVVVHELAHLRVPGHPPRFWQEVARQLPDYRGRRQWLKVYGAPFLLWKFEPINA
jgi:predicted metal-dependent hydrolase